MRYLPDGEQMKAADTYTIQEIGVPSVVLMERAALKIVETMEQEQINTECTLIVCGSGNNGGDGFAVARLLLEKGKHVEVLFAGKESSLSEECRLQKEIVENLGIPVLKEFPEKRYTALLDAVFGVGLSREITGHYQEVIEWMNQQEVQKVAVDIPSGICSSTGRVLGIAFQAQLTVSMACEKLGCAFAPGKNYAGKIVPVPIGISPEYFTDDPELSFTYEKEELARILPKRSADSHKGTYGRVLMITGSKGMSGAAYLSAHAAYTVGAGLVQIYTAEENRTVLQSQLPEAVISCYNGYDEAQLQELLDWADVICIGCGLGKSETAEKILSYTLIHAKCPCVIDADGLNLLSGKKESTIIFRAMRYPAILTPHMKEMARLSERPVSDISEHRMEVLKEYTAKNPVICVLKDSRTVVAQNGYQKFVNLAGNHAMAKGGSGDVLAGVITGLLAQEQATGRTERRMNLFKTATAGVFLHACGGDAARDAKGGYSVLARDLIDGIQTAMKEAERCR